MTTNPKDLIARTRELCAAATPGRTSKGQSAQSYYDRLTTGKRELQDALPELLLELADALAGTYRDFNHQVYLRDKDREASWKHVAEIERARDEEINSLRAALELHPDGRCVCHGEGECDFCRRCQAEIEREEAQAKLIETRERKVWSRRELEGLKDRACDALEMPRTTDSHSVGDRIEILINALKRERDKALAELAEMKSMSDER